MKVDTLGRRSESFPLQTWQERKVPYDECAVGVRRLRAPGVGGGGRKVRGGMEELCLALRTSLVLSRLVCLVHLAVGSQRPTDGCLSMNIPQKMLFLEK